MIDWGRKRCTRPGRDSESSTPPAFPFWSTQDLSTFKPLHSDPLSTVSGWIDLCSGPVYLWKLLGNFIIFHSISVSFPSTPRDKHTLPRYNLTLAYYLLYYRSP